MEIKKYSDKYRSDVQSVCARTGPPEAAYEDKMHKYIVNMFCNYYIDYEPDNVFILVDDNDVAQGYILCCSDVKKFRQNMGKYFKIVRNTGLANVIEGHAEYFGTLFFSDDSTAHMHIDINYEYNYKGYGSKLITKEFEHLRSKGIKNLMLIVCAGNEEAIGFYHKHGFKEKLNAFGGLIMVKNLEE